MEGADQRLTSQVHEIVGRINGRYGSVTFVPIHHLASSRFPSMFSSLSPSSRVSYTISDELLSAGGFSCGSLILHLWPFICC
jgi:hypothetical protein